MSEVSTQRLTLADRELARRAFAMMAAVFDEAGEGPGERLDDGYLDAVLSRPDFWALVALVDDEPVGAVSAHALPMTRSPSFELFIYDLAVRADYQRRGIGRRLIAELRAGAAAAGIVDSFVPADNEDVHALDFYRAVGGVGAPVTIFSFSSESEE